MWAWNGFDWFQHRNINKIIHRQLWWSIREIIISILLYWKPRSGIKTFVWTPSPVLSWQSSWPFVNQSNCFNSFKTFSVQLASIGPKQIDGHFFNSTNWIFILSGTPMLLSSLAFFVYQAKTAFDFGLSFYYSSCLIFGGIFYIIYIWKVENISKFIENCETFIEQRKLNNYKIIWWWF